MTEKTNIYSEEVKRAITIFEGVLLGFGNRGDGPAPT